MTIKLDGLGDVSDQQRRLTGLVLQIAGLGDIVFGVLIAFLGPSFIGDPSLNTVLFLAGGFLVLTGIGIIWWARRRFAAPDEGEAGSTVVRARH